MNEKEQRLNDIIVKLISKEIEFKLYDSKRKKVKIGNNIELNSLNYLI